MIQFISQITDFNNTTTGYEILNKYSSNKEFSKYLTNKFKHISCPVDSDFTSIITVNIIDNKLKYDIKSYCCDNFKLTLDSVVQDNIIK
jgi:hypothetical protein